MRRDVAKFTTYGILASDILALEEKITLFSDGISDIEILGDQTNSTALKNIIGDELRTAIRDLMTRVQLVFKPESSNYRKFGTDTLSKQSDAELLFTSRRVVRVGYFFLSELEPKGVSATTLADIVTLGNNFENGIIDLKIKIGDRDVMQEERVEAANLLYEKLVSYTNTGQSMWANSNVAKYNDYVIYNTLTGEPLDDTL
ncbi:MULTISPECIES: hypothetical protein [Flavobacterium]|uniref:Uncharacterized protein n=1 Tax=Flavobacterium jumunjinense TaxID=998845 RepID=A0ABV5GQK3_9FLAO|nr:MULTISPECIES: hypothetical protein [Flavobacterium]